MIKTRTSGIYRIRCTETGKIYIGSSADIDTRWYQHRLLLQRGKHHNNYLQHAWSKHGAEAFEFEVVECVEPESLLDREQHWIDATRCFDQKCGYNLASIAGAGIGGARLKVRDDDARGGARADAGAKPDLVARISKLRSKLQHHRYKFNAADLEALRHALGAALADVVTMMKPDEEWDGEIL